MALLLPTSAVSALEAVEIARRADELRDLNIPNEDLGSGDAGGSRNAFFTFLCLAPGTGKDARLDTAIEDDSHVEESGSDLGGGLGSNPGRENSEKTLPALFSVRPFGAEPRELLIFGGLIFGPTPRP